MNIKTIKIAALLSIFSLGVIFPVQVSKSFLVTLVFALVLFIAGLFTPFSIQYNSLLNHFIIKSPKWSDSFSHKAPLTYTHFFGYFMLFGGLGELFGQFLVIQTISFFGSGLIGMGLGLLIGNLLALKFPHVSNATK